MLCLVFRWGILFLIVFKVSCYRLVGSYSWDKLGEWGMEFGFFKLVGIKEL